MSILLTGANGYIASHIDLTRFSLPVIGLDQSHGSDIQSCISKVSKKWLEENQVSQVVHLADLRLQYYRDNNFQHEQDKQKMFLQTLASYGKINHIVYASSCSVYGQSVEEVDESSVVNPTTLYAKAKLGTEEMLAKLGLPFTILRFGTAYGGHSKIRDDLFVNMLIKKLLKKETTQIFGANAWRPYINAVDFAEALLFFLGRPDLSLTNVTESNQRKQDVVKALVSMGLDSRLLCVDPDRQDPRSYYVRSDKVRGLGFRFELPFEKGLKTLFQNLQFAD